MRSFPLRAIVSSIALLSATLWVAVAVAQKRPIAPGSVTDVTPPIVDQAVAVEFPVTPAKTIFSSTNRVDVTFSEAVDPVTAQDAANYAYSGPVTRTVVSAVLDGSRPELVHLVLSGAVGPSAGFHDITVAGVQDLAANVIVADGDTNVGSFFIQMLNFQADLTQRLCSNMFTAADSVFVEGDLAPLSFAVGDNARLTDPNVDSTYTGFVPMAMPKDRATGKAEADLEWSLGHRPSAPTLENFTRTTHLSSDNGSNVILAASWDDDPVTCTPASLFTFAQLDVRLGESYGPNSGTGVCLFDYVAHPNVAYLNIAMRHPETLQPVWVIRNFLLPDSGRAAPVEQFAMRFPLSYLGFPAGTDVTSLTFSHLVTGARLADPDTATWYPTLVWQPPVPVADAEYNAQGAPTGADLITTAPPLTDWFTAQVQGKQKWYSWAGCDIPNVELDSTTHGAIDINGCVPAACANSLKWLDDGNANFQLPALRKLYEELSYIMGRDQYGRGVTDSAMVVGKLDLIEAYKLPIKVKFQGVLPEMKRDIKSSSGLTSATCRDTTPNSWPKWGFLAAEAEDDEDVEITGSYGYGPINTPVYLPMGHAVVVTGVLEDAGDPKINYKDDIDQRHPGGTRESGTEKIDTTSAMKFPLGDAPVGPNGSTVFVTFYVKAVISESYDANAAATTLPDTHTFSAYCQEFRRTIPPRTKVTINMPNRQGCANTTINFLHRAPQPPKWINAHEWNLRQGNANEYVNTANYPVTISIHNDDGTASVNPYQISLAMTPLPTPPEEGQAPALPEEEPTPNNPDAWGGFSLGGTSGGPDEFGSPAGPSVFVDASLGRDLSQVPGRMGNGVQQLTITRPIPVWNPYWSQVGLHLVVSTVHSPGTLVVDCPATGLTAPIPISQPGEYTVNLGSVPQTSLFTLNLSTAGGLDLEFDAIGVPSLVIPVAGVEPDFVPRVSGLRNLGPTPSRGSVSLRFDVPRRGRVDAEIFDVRGRRIATILSGTLEAGSHGRIWNGSGSTGHPVPSGVYFCRMKIGRESHTTRIVINR